MRDTCIRTEVLMGTVVTIQVASEGAERLEPAFAWFRHIEACCSRFDAASEVMQLTAKIGVAVPVSEMLYQAVQFALRVADASDGAFDPTVGHAMESRGFNREYWTGEIAVTAVEPCGSVSYRDVRLDPERKTITLDRPLILDLGAVAKGLAIDLAAEELRPFKDFAIDAGGDLYLGGCRPDGAPWSVGIRHPRRERELIDRFDVSDMAVCTSGDYEQRNADEADGHHILDPRTGASPGGVASVTTVAPTAMLADGVGTAAFVLGAVDGLRLCERLGVEALIVSPACERYSTRGMPCRLEEPR